MTRARETSENARLAKAWVNFNGAFGTSPFTEANGGIRSSFNVSSVTDNGVGEYTINMTNPMSDSNYTILCGGSQDNNTTTNDRFVSAYALSTTTIKVIFSGWTNGNSKFDGSTICISIFR